MQNSYQKASTCRVCRQGHSQVLRGVIWTCRYHKICLEDFRQSRCGGAILDFPETVFFPAPSPVTHQSGSLAGSFQRPAGTGRDFPCCSPHLELPRQPWWEILPVSGSCPGLYPCTPTYWGCLDPHQVSQSNAAIIIQVPTCFFPIDSQINNPVNQNSRNWGPDNMPECYKFIQ